MIAIAGGQIYPFLDPVGGCLVSLLIIRVGFQSGKSACQEIVDRGLDPETLQEIRLGAENGLHEGLKSVLPDVVSGGMSVGSVKGTKSGAYYIVDVEVEGSGDVRLETFERVGEEVREGVRAEVKSAKIVRVHFKTRKDGTDGS